MCARACLQPRARQSYVYVRKIISHYIDAYLDAFRLLFRYERYLEYYFNEQVTRRASVLFTPSLSFVLTISFFLSFFLSYIYIYIYIYFFLNHFLVKRHTNAKTRFNIFSSVSASNSPILTFNTIVCYNLLIYSSCVHSSSFSHRIYIFSLAFSPSFFLTLCLTLLSLSLLSSDLFTI